MPTPGAAPATARQRRWTVVVQQGMVVAAYAPDEAAADGRDNILAGHGSGYADVYTVDAATPPPPVGTEVDPPSLGWIPWTAPREPGPGERRS